MTGRKKLTESAIHKADWSDFDSIHVPDVLRDIVRFNRGDAMAVATGFVVIEANEAYARILGASSPEELRGADMSGLVTPESVKAGMERVRRRAAGEIIKDPYVYEGKTLEGRPLKAEVRAVAWPPNPEIALQSIRDVTEREQRLGELKYSEKLYRTMAKALPVGVVFRQSSGELAFVNDWAVEKTGFSRDEIDRGALLADLDDEYLRTFKNAFEKGVPLRSLRSTVTLKNGSTALLQGDCVPLHEPDGTYWGMCYIFQDETDKVKAAAALQEAHDNLLRAYEEQRKFVLDVAHEVRTPLTAITGYSKMLLQRVAGPLSEQQESMVRRSLASSEHMLGVVNDVLTVARLKGGMAVRRPTKCNPRDIVESVIKLALPEAKTKGIEVDSSHICEHCAGIYDEEKLRAVIVRLITNAVKFTQQGGVEISGTCDSQGVEIIVADTGIGIPEDRFVTMFDELHHPGRTRPHKFPADAIGLGIVAKMLETIGATLTVSSEPGVGTAFTFYAPVLDEKPPA